VGVPVAVGDGVIVADADAALMTLRDALRCNLEWDLDRVAGVVTVAVTDGVNVAVKDGVVVTVAVTDGVNVAVKDGVVDADGDSVTDGDSEGESDGDGEHNGFIVKSERQLRLNAAAPNDVSDAGTAPESRFVSKFNVLSDKSKNNTTKQQ
jgi:hypothetical protein